MVEDVKSRRYTSTLRQQQATATRTRITEAAAELFAARGYPRTSIEQVAAKAGVARPTVYATFGGKAALLKQALDVAFAGDDEPVPVSQRPWFREMLEQRDQHRMLELYARNLRQICERVAELYEAVRNAAAGDDEVAELYATLKRQRLVGARTVVEPLAALGPLRDGLDTDTATDLMSHWNDPALWTALVTDRDWPAERFQTWLARTMQESLLGPRR